MHAFTFDPGSVGELVVAREGPTWVVIEKPAGMLSVPGKGPEKADCVVSRVRAMFPESDGPLVVHRLDMDTSGLLVLGLTADAQRALSMQFERREVEKKYVALVEGMVEREEGVIELPMRLNVERRPYQVIDFERGREATTRWRVLSYETDRTRLELRPETGRSHQLRVHCAAAREIGGLGHAIVGDVLYGEGVGVVGRDEEGNPSPDSSAMNRPLPEGEVVGERLMLHACWLRFRCPLTEKGVEVESIAPF